MVHPHLRYFSIWHIATSKGAERRPRQTTQPAKSSSVYFQDPNIKTSERQWRRYISRKLRCCAQNMLHRHAVSLGQSFACARVSSGASCKLRRFWTRCEVCLVFLLQDGLGTVSRTRVSKQLVQCICSFKPGWLAFWFVGAEIVDASSHWPDHQLWWHSKTLEKLRSNIHLGRLQTK